MGIWHLKNFIATFRKADGNDTKLKAGLRSFVCEKKLKMDNLVCHCFSYSGEDIEQDYLNNGRSKIMEKIKLEKKFGNCQCAVKNPKGR